MTSRQDIFRKGLQIRRAEELLLEAFRDGHIRGTVHTCLGQELIPVLVNEYFADAFWFSNHRGHGHYLAKTSDYAGLFSEILGRDGGVSKGIGGSQHLFTNGFISNGIQGGQAGIAAGYASPRIGKDASSVMFIGDGTLGAGHLYETWNIAAVERSRVLFIVEDNQIAQSTPSSNTFRGDLENRTKGFGLSYLHAQDSNLDSIKLALNQARLNLKSNTPTVLHIETKRLGPHSKGDDNRAPNEIESLWQNDLLSTKITLEEISYSDPSVKDIERIFREVLERKPTGSSPLIRRQNQLVSRIPSHNPNPINLQTHINQSLLSIAESNPDLYFLGEDISDDQFRSGNLYGGAFKVTSHLSSRFPERVFSTPISESGLTGYGIGMALYGRSVIVEIMFGDFLTQNYDQIVHQMSKIPSMYGQFIPLKFVIRTAVGGGRGYGPTHSASMENILVGLPNITLVSINQFSNYLEILKWALDCNKPMIILESKILYSQRHQPEIYDQYEFATNELHGLHNLRPKFQKPQAAIITYGSTSQLVLQSLQGLAERQEIFVEVVILEVLSPFIPDEVTEIIKRSGNRLVIVEESIDGAGAGSFTFTKLAKSGITPSLLHLHLGDWHPSGFLEEAFLLNTEALISKVTDWINDGIQE
jgi:2-oxoisovalerate dehydrogenase E1 component